MFKRLALLSVAFCLACLATEFKLKNGKTEILLESRGSVIRSLVFNDIELSGKSKECLSFCDQTLGTEDDHSQLMEDFSELEFEARDVLPSNILFSCRGIGAFNWLRLEKKYTLKNDKELNVEYALINCSDAQQSAGLWTKSFLVRDTGIVNACLFPSDDGTLRIIDYPSGTQRDEWSFTPAQSILGVYGRQDKTGCIIHLPKEMVSGYYDFFSTSRNLATNEWFLREQPIAPRGTLSFIIRLQLSTDVPALLAKLPEKDILLSKSPKGKETLVNKKYGKDDKTIKEVYKKSAKSSLFVDLNPPRQPNDSIRSLKLPEDWSHSKIGVFELANGCSSYDRPVPFVIRDGELLFKVNGYCPEGAYCKKGEDGRFKEIYSKNRDRGPATMPVRIEAERPENAPVIPLDATVPSLIVNGDWEEAGAKPNMPAGNMGREFTAANTHFHWEKCGKNGSYGVRINMNPENKRAALFSIPLWLERGIKYTVAADIKCENPAANWSVVSVNFFDDNMKPLPRGKDIHLQDDRTRYDWKHIEKIIMPPAGASHAQLYIRAYGPQQTLWFDNLVFRPEPYSATPRSPIEIMRDELKGSYYYSIDYAEKLNLERQTPHRDWLVNTVEQMPEVLGIYWGYSSVRIETTDRRRIPELYQRMDFPLKPMAIFKHVLSMQGSSIWHRTFGNDIEPYSVEMLKAIENPPKLVLLNNLNFKTEIQQEVIDIWADWQKRGSAMLFMNCDNVPETLLGKPIPLPEEILGTIPQMREVKPWDIKRVVSAYQGPVSRNMIVKRFTNDCHYQSLYCFPCVPAEKAGELVSSYDSRDFPYWEYISLLKLKAMRNLADVALSVKALSCDGTTLKLQVSQAICDNKAEVTLEQTFTDLHRRVLGKSSRKMTFDKAGIINVQLDFPELPEKSTIVEYFLKDANGRIYDSGAALAATQSSAALQSVRMSRDDRIYGMDEDITVLATISRAPAGAKLQCWVEDSFGRTVRRFQQDLAIGKELRFTFRLDAPHTFLYTVFADVMKDGTVLDTQAIEFSYRRPSFLQPDEVASILWKSQGEALSLIHDLGYKLCLTNFANDNVGRGSAAAIVNSNLEVISFGGGTISVPWESRNTYRGDVKTDPVRNPCFNDPAHIAKTQELIDAAAKKSKFNYYNVRAHALADEAFLGQSVCYSEHCLGEFRKFLKGRYASLEQLNKQWETSFATWEEVKPCQLEELQSRENLAQWLEHKLFMSTVFARNWVGTTVEQLRKTNPEAFGGLSGTAGPGYSFDWAQMPKYNPLIMCYGGIQRNMICDLAPKGTIIGAWSGYQTAITENESTIKQTLWHNLFSGMNVIATWPGEMVLGDLSISKGMQYYSEGMKELQAGIGKMMLHSVPARRDVAVLYSQSSLYSAMGTHVGNTMWQDSQNSWAGVMLDMSIDHRFISYEELQKTAPPEKVLILSATLSLDEAMLDNIDKYVRNGGTVIADFGTGWFDGHGTVDKARKAATLFGVDRSAASLMPDSPRKYLILNEQTAKTGPYQMGESGIKATDAIVTAAFEDGSPAIFQRKLGKGRLILLNLAIDSYSAISLGGVGGEETIEKNGSLKYRDDVQKLVLNSMAAVNVHPNCVVTDEKGRPVECKATLRKDGENFFFGFLLSTRTGAPFAKLPRKKVHVELPFKGFAIALRRNLILGQCSAFDLEMTPGDAEVIALLPQKPGKIVLDVPRKVKAGELATIGLSTKNGKGNHTYHLEFVAPDGTVPEAYARNLYLPAKGGKDSFQFAFSDQPGKWKIRVKNLTTSATSEETFTLVK